MKKKLFICIAVILALCGIITLVSLYNRYPSIMGNVEVLMQSEGTPVRNCYFDNNTGSWEYAYQCNSETTDELIFPCGDPQFIHKSTSNKCVYQEGSK